MKTFIIILIVLICICLGLSLAFDLFLLSGIFFWLLCVVLYTTIKEYF